MKFRGLSDIQIASTLPLLNPVYLYGKTEKGFGRGSSLLGIPTANLPADLFEKELRDIDNGVYFGWAKVSSHPKVFKTVLSIGNNPYFKDIKRKTIEPHILHDFGGRNLYGEELKLIILGYIRDMKGNFHGIEALKARILKDIEIARKALNETEYSSFRNSKFFFPQKQTSSTAAMQANLLGNLNQTQTTKL